MKTIQAFLPDMKTIQAFLLGMYEFRLSFTTHFEDYDLMNAYDSGRELAHCVTFRRYEHY